MLGTGNLSLLSLTLHGGCNGGGARKGLAPKWWGASGRMPRMSGGGALKLCCAPGAPLLDTPPFGPSGCQTGDPPRPLPNIIELLLQIHYIFLKTIQPLFFFFLNSPTVEITWHLHSSTTYSHTV